MSGRNEKVSSIFQIPLKTCLKICFFVVFVAFILLQCIYFLDVRLPLEFYQISNGTTKKQMQVKTILYWTKMFDSKSFYFGEYDIFKNCEVAACRATSDRDFIKIEDFDALLFHGIEVKASDLPSARSPKQKYIFVDLESPVTYPLGSAINLNNFYNWTLTYRRDSDIPRTYGYIVDSVTNNVVYPLWARTSAMASVRAYENLRSPGNATKFEGKRKSAAWFVSHCGTAGLRDNYAAELQKYIDVDIYGKCGPLSCSNKDVKCYEMLESDYYFYLSFENSLCQDYVTEKLYKVMAYNIVPIVYGAANYTEFAPPGSYINVVDFENPKHLANHLRYLMSNPEEYAKFFWWKKRYFIDLGHGISACQMCKMLHNETSLASSNIPDLKKWWSEGICLNSVNFLKRITRN